jgi:hypothetical protein
MSAVEIIPFIVSEFEEYDAVPNKLPVNPLFVDIDPVTCKLPVIIADPVYGKVDDAAAFTAYIAQLAVAGIVPITFVSD